MAANLPPEMGKELERLFKKESQSENGGWIADYAGFSNVESHGITVSRVHVKDEDMAGLLSKSVGHYSTLQTGPLGEYDDLENVCDCLTEELDRYLTPYKGKTILICGIGNQDILADSLGPKTAKKICPHLPMKSAFEKLAVLIPGVSGVTNIRNSTAITSVSSAIGAACVLTIDSTCCADYSRLCRRIELTDTGLRICENGVKLSPSTLGVPVVSVGVPCVIRTKDLAPDMDPSGRELLIPADMEDIVKRASLMIACAILRVAFPELDHNNSMMIADSSLM